MQHTTLAQDSIELFAKIKDSVRINLALTIITMNLVTFRSVNTPNSSVHIEP